MRQPCVGIFWKVSPELDPEADGIVSYSTPLSEAEPYGEFLTCPVGHYELWEQWRNKRRGGPEWIVSRTMLTYEYEYFPRGRVVYHQPSQTFWIYSDPLIQTSPVVQRIADRFNLSAYPFIAKLDAHYTTRGV